MTTRQRTSHSYFVVMLSYPARYCDGVRISVAGQEAIVDPEQTRADVVSRIKSREYEQDEIVFIHHVDGLFIEDVTDSLIEEAQSGFRTFARPDEIDQQAARFDHTRDLRKHEVV
jgi:hypothetical protein